jgi:glucose/arabinose dehydrogenase
VTFGHPDRRLRVLVIGLLIAGSEEMTPDSRAGVAASSSGFAQDLIAVGFEFPTAMVMVPDGRILVAEKAGLVWVIENGTVLPTPFADFCSRVNNFWDRGLTGLTIDPNFAANHLLACLQARALPGSQGQSP